MLLGVPNNEAFEAGERTLPGKQPPVDADHCATIVVRAVDLPGIAPPQASDEALERRVETIDRIIDGLKE